MSAPDIHEKFVLAPDVIIAPVSSLPEAVRDRIDASDHEFAITRPRARRPSTVVDPESAGLLEGFREAKPILEAVLAYSEKTGVDSREVLTRAFPILEHLRAARFLVPADSPEATRIRPTLAYRDRWDDLEILRAIQVVDDTEVYQARGADGVPVALKIARPDAEPWVHRLLEREAAVLRRLDGVRAPRLLAVGERDGSPYVTMEWIRGVSSRVAARELRDTAEAGRPALGELCVDVARAYEALHGLGVVHSDVQPANLLVDGEGRAILIDFAFARIAEDDGAEASGDGAALREGRVPYHMSPEDAALRQKRIPALEPTRLGEQYAIATLLYRLITGEHYLDFRLEADRFLQQILAEDPLPFSRRGTTPWPEVENVLGRALSKRPEDRYASTAAFREALEGAVAARSVRARAAPSPGLAYLDRLASDVLETLRIEGPLFESGPPVAPTGSVTFGRAGIAYMLYRSAVSREDPRWLAAADAWITRAEQEAGSPGAFLNPEYSVTDATVEPASPYHREAGVQAVRAIVSHAMGDVGARNAGIRRFIELSSDRGTRPDLTVGVSGTVLVSALLLEMLPRESAEAVAAVRELANASLARLWGSLESDEPVPRSRILADRALAHGWAGVLYATLRWCRAAGEPYPEALSRRLEELASCAEEDGRGVRWRIVERTTDGFHTRGFGTSWCNGTAGFTFLWTLAARCLGEESYAELAERTAWNVWEGGGDVLNLCCGLGGRAYALLNVYKSTGDGAWLERARRLLDRTGRAHERFAAGSGNVFAHSLYKGDVGLALSSLEASAPERACMPFFEEEGWPTEAARP